MPEVYYDVTVRGKTGGIDDLIDKVTELEDKLKDLKKEGVNIGLGGGGGGGGVEKDKNDLGGTGMGYGFMAQMRAYLKKGLVNTSGYRESREQYETASATGMGKGTVLKAGLKMGAIAGAIGLIVGGVKMLGNTIKTIVQKSEVFQSIVNLTLSPFILMVNLMLVPALMMLIPYIIELFTWVTDNQEGLKLFGTGFASPMTLLLEAITNNPIVSFTKNLIETLTAVSQFGSGDLNIGETMWSVFANSLQVAFSFASLNTLFYGIFHPFGIDILGAISDALDDTLSIGDFWINVQNMWGEFWTDLGNAFIDAYNTSVWGNLFGKMNNLEYESTPQSSDSGFSKSGDTYIFDGVVFNQGDSQYSNMGEALEAHIKSLGGMN